MNKKGQTQLIVNVVLGMIFLVVIFVCFLLISNRLKDVKERDIRDFQGEDLADSYILSLRLLNSEQYEELSNYIISLRDNESFFGSQYDQQEFETYEGDLTQVQERSVSKKDEVWEINILNFLYVFENEDFAFTSVLDKDRLLTFQMTPFFTSPDLKDVSGVNCLELFGNGWDVAVEDSFESSYCKIKEVLYE